MHALTKLQAIRKGTPVEQATQLHALAPASALAETVSVKSVQVQGERRVEQNITHNIEPFTYRQFFKVLAHANKIFSAIASYDGSMDLDDPIGMLRLVTFAGAEAGDDVQAVVALAIGRDVSYLDTLSFEEGLKLTLAVIRVNKDFFVQRILPMIPTLKAEWAAATANTSQAGETS